MTQVSKYPLKKEIENRMREVFLDSIGYVNTRDQVLKLTNDLLSNTERIMLSKRLAIALLLSKGYDQRSVSNLLHVGLTTVNRVNTALTIGSGGYTMVINTILQQEKYENILEKIDDSLADIFHTGKRWSTLRKIRYNAKLKDRKPF